VRAFGDLAVGEHVFAIGAPRGLERTLSEGLLSGLRHQPGRNLVQTSAAISPGSSGGGLFDERGNLIGITTMQLIGVAQNLNFAVAAGDYWNGAGALNPARHPSGEPNLDRRRSP